jgi:hypothetical protein
MKKLILFFCIMLFSAVPLKPARELEQFLRGNKLFQEGKPEEALKEYQEITQKGPLLWHNIGMCHYQQKNFIEALVALKKAELGANAQLLLKIEPFIKEIQAKYNQPHQSEKMRLLKRLASHLSLFWLLFLTVFFWWLIAFLWNTALLSNAWVRFSFVALWLFCSVTTGVVWWLSTEKIGIITDETSLYVGPNEKFHKTGTVTKGQQVVIKKQHEDWFKIKSTDASGWVLQTRLEPIESNI